MSAIPVSDHSLYLIVPFSLLGSSENERGSLLDNLSGHSLADLRERLEAPETLAGSDDAVWRSHEGKLSPDLHRRICEFLQGRDEPDVRHADAFAPFRLQLDPGAINLLTGRVGTRGDWRFHLPLRKRAAARLRARGHQAADEIPFVITGASFLSAAVGVGLLTLELAVIHPDEGELSQWVLIEAVHALSRRWERQPELRWGPAGEEGVSVSLVQVADSLAPDLWTGGGPEARRTFTYTAARLSGEVSAEELVEISFRLSRGYTEDYLPTREEIERNLVHPFANVLHVTALEGGSTVVASDGGVPFLDGYVRSTAPAAYLPICQAAFIEHIFLRSMYDSIQFRVPAPDAIGESATSELSQFLARLLDFRLNHRFHHVSDVTMHNEVYTAWRRALALDSMGDEVGQDVQDVAAFLGDVGQAREERQARRHERDRVRASRMQTVLGIFVGGMVFLTGFFGMNFSGITGEPDNLDTTSIWVWLIVGATVALSASGAFAYAFMTRERRIRDVT